MTPDERSAVVALLERKLNATAPREADPVTSVMRRARARRRRVVASACAVALGVAGLGAAGALATGQGTSRTSAPADDRPASPKPSPDLAGATNVRQVTDWAGETVSFHGLTLPVPAGWTVRHSTDRRGTCADGTPKTLWLFDVPASQEFIGGCHLSGGIADQMWVVPQVGLWGSNGGDNPLALDPSGQPVWQPVLSPGGSRGIGFPWLHVWVHTSGMSDTELMSMLGAIRADPVAPRAGLQLPDRIDEAGYARFGGASRQAPKPDGTVDPDLVERVLRTTEPDTKLRCVPQVGALLHVQKNPADWHAGWDFVAFDPSGDCTQVTDDHGGLATLDPVALQTLAEQVHAPSE